MVVLRDIAMYRIVLLRHGQSVWNQDKRFTGWTDIDLSPKGVAEARAAAARMAAAGLSFDVCFSSVLRRARETARIVLESMRLEIPLRASWRLNERHYGALQGLSFLGGLRRFGVFPVIRCQRQFAVAPPLLPAGDPRLPSRDPLYADADSAQLPAGESLRDTLARVLPYWEAEIAPEIRRHRRVLVVAHRNTMRSLIKHLEGVPDEAALRIKVPTAVPLIYDLGADMKALGCRRLEKPG
jgi:2,3-bisphosphoglycerate-dependent phosphoglycerate mutase